jgi:hypothetical protein
VDVARKKGNQSMERLLGPEDEGNTLEEMDNVEVDLEEADQDVAPV